MDHFTIAAFWGCYNALPEDVQELADRCFTLLKVDPTHPSLQLKPVGRVWSARVGLHYRALAVKRSEGFVWFWIGSHAEYDKLVE